MSRAEQGWAVMGWTGCFVNQVTHSATQGQAKMGPILLKNVFPFAGDVLAACNP